MCTCRICGNEENNKILKVKERMLNEGETFEYVLCNKCGTLQIGNIPSDIGKYYPQNYYSFDMKKDSGMGLKSLIRKLVYKIVVNQFVQKKQIKRSGMFWKLWSSNINNYMLLATTQVKSTSAILDVGCGDGHWLSRLRECGFTNLTGIDAFASQMRSREGLQLLCTDIFDDSLSKYNLITFHHSFEHMEDPEKVLKRVRELLLPGGKCLIRIPVCDSWAFEEYGENWFQLDAPRHYYLYSKNAFIELCKKYGFDAYEVICDSAASQILYSEEYMRTNKSFEEIRASLTMDMRKDKKEKVDSLNREGIGDQVCFYLELKQ